MESPSVNFKRAEAQNLVSLLGTASELHGGNVLLILDNNVKLSTHICFLSSSPILKRLVKSSGIILQSGMDLDLLLALGKLANFLPPN